MEIIAVSSDFYTRKCKVCKYNEKLPRAGKLYVGYSVSAESKRDFERREYAKDLLQAYDVRGNPTEEFQAAYGDPKKRGKAKGGAKMEKEWKTQRQIRRAREKIKNRYGKP